jgi:hypothetical protein
VLGFDPQKQVFEKMGLDVSQPASGCCGLAGSFGFEAGKYQISSDCGERVILPEVRKAEDGVLILADGFSCRTQIEQGTGRRALHLAEALKLALEPARAAAPAAHPEHEIVARRNASVVRSIRRARVTAAAGLLAIAGLAALLVARKLS